MIRAGEFSLERCVSRGDSVSATPPAGGCPRNMVVAGFAVVWVNTDIWSTVVCVSGCLGVECRLPGNGGIVHFAIGVFPRPDDEYLAVLELAEPLGEVRVIPLGVKRYTAHGGVSVGLAQLFQHPSVGQGPPLVGPLYGQIGRASCRKECRSRW